MRLGDLEIAEFDILFWLDPTNPEFYLSSEILYFKCKFIIIRNVNLLLLSFLIRSFMEV